MTEILFPINNLKKEQCDYVFEFKKSVLITFLVMSLNFAAYIVANKKRRGMFYIFFNICVSC